VSKLNRVEEIKALVRLEDMESHFRVVWCNFGAKHEFN